MTLLSAVLGAVVVATVLVDISLTLLHPSARGPLSYRVNRSVWLAVRRLSGLTRSRRVLSYAGPTAFAMNFFAWVVSLWIGFALIYLPFIDGFSFDSSVPFGRRGVLEALYISGTALTTVGFGDVVASSSTLRLVTVLNGACGLGAFTAAITYAVSVYPLVAAIRGAALRRADLGLLEPALAARVAVEGGPTELAALQNDLIENDENIKRFPILYYFESGEESESITCLIRSGVITCLVLQWGLSRSAHSYAEVYGPSLETTLDRLMDHYEQNFVGGRTKSRSEHPYLDERDLADRLRVLREEMDRAGVEAPDRGDGDEIPDGFGRFVSRSEPFLAQLAREHLNPHEPLLGRTRPEKDPTARAWAAARA